MAFALASTVIFALIAGAVQYSMLAKAHTNMQTALDGTALTLATIPEAERAKAAEAAFAARLSTEKVRDVQITMTNLADGSIDMTATGSYPTMLAPFTGLDKITISARSAASPPTPIPKSATLTLKKASGWWFKEVSVWVLRRGASAYTKLGTFTYQPTILDNSGASGAPESTLTMDPSTGVVDLGDYDKLYLNMTVGLNGCPPPQRRKTDNSGFNGEKLECVTPTPANPGYVLPGTPLDQDSYDLRTDQAATSSYLFVNGVQMPPNTVPELSQFLPCNKTVSHSWEDGGNFSAQDIFFDVTSTCAAGVGKQLRLTR